jgi:hypothetical protein
LDKVETENIEIMTFPFVPLFLFVPSSLLHPGPLSLQLDADNVPFGSAYIFNLMDDWLTPPH